jgi:DNA repair protein RadC
MKTAPVYYTEKPEVLLGNVPEINIPELKIHYSRKYDERFAIQIKSANEASEILRKIYPSGELEIQEQFIMLYLNRNNKVIGYYRHSKGGITGTAIDVRLVMAVAIQTGAVGIIMSHNHPSGNAEPSNLDITITKAVKNAAEYFDIALFDHVIITKDSFFSFGGRRLVG